MATNHDLFPIFDAQDFTECESVLDIGVGGYKFLEEGHKMQWPWKEVDLLYKYFGEMDVYGIDAFDPHITWRNEHGPKGKYQQMLLQDILNVKDVFGKENFDIVMCHHVLEHVNYSEIQIATENMIKLADKKVVIGGPTVFHDNAIAVQIHHNKYEKHVSNLKTEYFEKLGFEIHRVKDVFVGILNK